MDDNTATIDIQFSPVRCRILTLLSSEIEDLLYSILAYRSDGYFFSPKFQSGAWDGYNRLYSKRTHSFRPGMIYRVKGALENEGFLVNIIGAPASVNFQQHNDTYELRGYQKIAVSKILQYRFGILQSPPRSGKTLMALASLDSEREFPAVILCRSLDLAAQTKLAAEKVFPNFTIGFIGDGRCEIDTITIVTVQSAYSAFNKKYKVKRGEYKEALVQNKELVRVLFEGVKIVFYDEAHESSGRTSRVVLDKCVSATMKIGLSATPFEENAEDALRVEEFVGPVIHAITYSELIKEGYLLAPNIYLYKLPKMVVEGNYQSVYKQAITDNAFLTGLVKKIVDSLVALGHSVVVQTEFREHSKQLAKVLGYPCLIGNEAVEKRKLVLDKLRSKEHMCVVSTLIEQGIDVPSLNYTINLVGGSKKIPTIQRMRSITADDDKTVCGVVDFEFQCKYLKKHSNKRKKFYKSEPEFNLILRNVSKKSLEEIT